MRAIWVTTLVCLASAYVHAQDSSSISFEQIDVPGTVRSSQVVDILQDPEGVIWLLHDGIVRYDGTTFTRYQTLADSGSVGGWESNCIMFDNAGRRLLVGTRNYGVVYYDYARNELRRLPCKDGVPIVNSLAQTSDGTIWASSYNSGLFYLQHDTLKRFVHEPAIRPTSLYAVDRDLYVGGYKTVYVYRDHQLRDSIRVSLPNESFEWNARATALKFGSDGHLYIGTEKEGLVVYDTLTKSVVRYFRPKESSFYSRINQVFEDSRGSVWILTKANGVVVYEPKTGSLTRFVKDPFSESSISGDFCSSIIEDHTGVIWIGGNGGLNKYDPALTKFFHVTKNPAASLSLSDKMVRGLYEDPQQRIWVGTDGGYLNIFDRRQNKISQIKITVPGIDRLIQPMCFFDLDARVMLIGTPLGLIQMDKVTRTFSMYKPLELQTKNRMVRQILQKGDKLYMVVAAKLLIYDLQTHDTKAYLTFGGTKRKVPNATAIYFDDQNRLWLGVGGGMSLFDEGRQHFIYLPFEADAVRPDGSYFMVLSIFQQGDTFWVGAFNSGLWALSYTDSLQYRVHKANVDDAVNNGTVYSTLPDKAGNLWLSTNQGLARYSPTDGHCYHFSKSEGVQDDEFNRLSFLQTQNGELCFGGINGFNLFDPQSIALNLGSVTPVLLNLTVFNDNKSSFQALAGQDQIDLPYNHNTFTLSFIVPDFRDPRRYNILYRLEGHDARWHTAQSGSVSYTHIPPGMYTFRVKTVDYGNKEKIASVKIHILKPFWTTWWFVLIVVAVVVFMIAAGIQIYLHKDRLDKLRLEELLRERTSEIEKSHEELQLLNQKKDLIFSILSHDLRSPLTTLKGFLGILIGDGGQLSREDIQRHAISIRNSVTNSLDLIDNTLFWSLSQMGNITYTPTTIRVELIFEKIRGLYQLTADKKQIKLSFQYEGNLRVEADENMLYVIVRNLVSNALKFTREGKTVTVLAFTKDESVCIQVVDQGVGMSTDQINRLLTMDQPVVKKGTSNEKGTGLGLLLCKQFVDMNKGMLTIYSHENEGTTVSVTIPKAAITA